MASAAVPRWVYYVTGGGALLGAYTAVDTVRSRWDAVPVMSNNVVKVEHNAHRFPCKVLKGFDVVIKNYYVKEQKPPVKREGGGWFSLFSNKENTVNANAPQMEQDVSTRLIVKRDKPVDADRVLAASSWPEGTQKYSAVVIEPSRGEETETARRDPLRWLADNATDQSLIRCNPKSTCVDMTCEGDPSYLGAPYLRLMLSGILFLPESLPSWRVAVLGVGGGSLPNFIQKYFSRKIGQLDMVDIEPQMFKAAVQELGMTQSLNVEKSDCVRLFAMDAGDYILSDHPRPSSYEELTSNEKGTRVVFTNHPASEKKPLDLLFVDLFVGSEVSGHIGSSGFIADCRTALASQGVVVFNLPDKNKIFVKQCESIFGSCNVFTIPTPLSSNQIVVARRAQGTETGLTGRAPQLTHRQLYHRAKELEQTYRLPYDLANHFPVWWRFW